MRHGELCERLLSGRGLAEVRQWAHGVLSGVADGSLDVPGVLHPLGFLCLPLERAPGAGVCLHLWSPELPPAAVTTSAWHCHSWTLHSLVLHGRVCNLLADTSEPGDLRVFEVRSREDGDVLCALDRTVKAVSQDGGAHGPGSVYALEAGRFHRTAVTGEAATVALGSDAPGGADLTLGPLGLATHRVRRAPGGRARTARLAGRFAALLAKGTDP